MKKLLTLFPVILTTVVLSSSVYVFASEKNNKEDEQKQNESVKPLKNTFYGYVEKMPDKKDGEWTINKRQVIVNTKTEFEGDVKLGSYVKVKGKLIKNIFTAYEIELKQK